MNLADLLSDFVTRLQDGDNGAIGIAVALLVVILTICKCIICVITRCVDGLHIVSHLSIWKLFVLLHIHFVASKLKLKVVDHYLKQAINSNKISSFIFVKCLIIF